jgi:hypothetical protein
MRFLGDGIEAGALRVRLANGSAERVVLPESEVFEDRTPRLADLDGDGRTEIITIRASHAPRRIGGGLWRARRTDRRAWRHTLYRAIQPLAEHCRYRRFSRAWRPQIAFVETPHIGGTLKLARFDGAGLQVVASQSGFSNHEIRAREQRLSAVADFDGDGAMDLSGARCAAPAAFGRAFVPEPSRLAVLDPAGGVGAWCGRLMRFWSSGRMERSCNHLVDLIAPILQPVAKWRHGCFRQSPYGPGAQKRAQLALHSTGTDVYQMLKNCAAKCTRRSKSGRGTMETIHHYIAGSLTEGSAAGHQPVFNPATGETPSQVVLGDASDVQAAVDAAKAALPGWAGTPTAPLAHA